MKKRSGECVRCGARAANREAVSPVLRADAKFGWRVFRDALAVACGAGRLARIAALRRKSAHCKDLAWLARIEREKSRREKRAR